MDVPCIVTQRKYKYCLAALVDSLNTAGLQCDAACNVPERSIQPILDRRLVLSLIHRTWSFFGLRGLSAGGASNRLTVDSRPGRRESLVVMQPSC